MLGFNISTGPMTGERGGEEVDLKELTSETAPGGHTDLMSCHVWAPFRRVWINGMSTCGEGRAQLFVRVKQPASGNNLLSAQNDVERLGRVSTLF